MRGGFVACLGGNPTSIDRIADRLRWHRGTPAHCRANGLAVAAFTNTTDGPVLEAQADSVLLVHGATPDSLSHIQQTQARFAAIAWDGRVLRASRDPLGLAPLFYRAMDDSVWFASEIRPLLALGSTVPHLPALTAKAAFVPLDEETGWRGIQRVLPGSAIEITPDLQIRSLRYWNPARDFGTYPGNRGEAVDEFRARFRIAVKRCFEAGSAIILSGGKDSAAVAMNTRATDGKPYLVHVHFPALPRTNEMRYAEAVAGALEAQLQILPGELRPWDAAAELDTHEIPYNWLPFGIDEPVLTHLATKGIAVALDGHDGDGVLGPPGAVWGEMLLSGALGRLEQLCHTYGIKRAMRGIAADFIPPSFRPVRLRKSRPQTYMQSVAAYFSERLQVQIRASDIDRWTWPATRWRARQLQPLLPRASISFEQKELEAARYGIDLRHPFADRQLVDLLISLPCALKADPERPKALMVEALGEDLPAIVQNRAKSDYMEVVRRRVDPAACLEMIRSSKVRLPDINYQYLFDQGDSDPQAIPIFLLVNLARVHKFAGRL